MKDLVIRAKETFGQARLITQPLGLHDTLTTALEVKGIRDGQWRRVGSLSPFTNAIHLNEDPKADPGDVRRVRALI